MRFLLVALLCAISYAQTELLKEEFEDDQYSDWYEEFLEVPIATAPYPPQIQNSGIEHVRKKFPHVIQICDGIRSIILPANPSIGLNEPITITFLQALDAGVYGAVVKVRAETKESSEVIALKMFVNNRRGEKIGNRKEIEIMEYLSMQMQEVLKIKLGPIMHEWNMDGIDYHGFGMELFEHGTVHAYFKQILSVVPPDIPSRVSFLLDEGPLRVLYQKCMIAIKRMWLLGVIHCDLHINNILYAVEDDIPSIPRHDIGKIIKIIDFGMSFMPKKTEELQFQIGTVYDFVWFTKSFVRWVLYPTGMHSKRDEAQVHSIMIELAPEIQFFTRGELPKTPEFDEIYQSFRDRHDISETQRRPWAAGIKYAARGSAPKFELNDSLGRLQVSQNSQGAETVQRSRQSSAGPSRQPAEVVNRQRQNSAGAPSNSHSSGTSSSRENPPNAMGNAPATIQVAVSFDHDYPQSEPPGLLAFHGILYWMVSTSLASICFIKILHCSHSRNKREHLLESHEEI